MTSNGSIADSTGDPSRTNAAGHELGATLVELVDLGLLGKQLQWCANGPLVSILHPRLGELVETWRRMADEAGERAASIGYWPDGQADAIAAGAEHTAVPRGPIEDQAVISLLAQCLTGLIERTRDRLARLGELDLISQNVLAKMVGELEQQQWTLRAQLPFGDRPATT